MFPSLLKRSLPAPKQIPTSVCRLYEPVCSTLPRRQLKCTKPNNTPIYTKWANPNLSLRNPLNPNLPLRNPNLPLNPSLPLVNPNRTSRRFNSNSASFHDHDERVAIFEVNDSQDFEERVLLSDYPIIVNFHAEWCEPCHTLTPVLQAFIMDCEYVCLATLDCEENIELVETFEVKAVPAIIAFKQGYIVDKFIGLIDENELKIFVKKLDAAHKNFIRGLV